MFQITSLRRCFKSLLLADVSNRFSSPMFQIASLRRCFKSLLFADVSNRFSSPMFQIASLRRCFKSLLFADVSNHFCSPMLVSHRVVMKWLNYPHIEIEVASHTGKRHARALALIKECHTWSAPHNT